jgi:hypothetical protein
MTDRDITFPGLRWNLADLASAGLHALDGVDQTERQATSGFYGYGYHWEVQDWQEVVG